MRSRRFASAILVFLGIVVGSTAWGVEWEDIAMHGFASQGYLKSSENNYLGNSKDGSYEYNEIGLNFSVLVADDLRFGIQMFSRDLGEYGNNDYTVDWAFLDYSWRDWLGFRAGKIKMPLGLYNRQRDADALRTAILLPQAVYNEGVRDFMVAIYGASLYGTRDLSAIGYIDYELFTGTFNMGQTNTYFDELFSRYSATHPEVFPPGLELSQGGNVIRHVEGAMLVWHTPLDGLKLSGTGVMGKSDSSMTIETTIETDTGPQDVQVTNDLETDINEISVLSAEYDFYDFTFAIERLKMDFSVESDAGMSLDISLEGWYAAISWEALNWLSLGASYGEYYPDGSDKDGDTFKDAGQKDYFAWQKDIALGVKLNVNEYWCFKFETHFMDGLGLADLDKNLEEPKQFWNLYVIKTSLSF